MRSAEYFQMSDRPLRRSLDPNRTSRLHSRELRFHAVELRLVGTGTLES